MAQLQGMELVLVIGTTIFGVLFFIAVSYCILRIFKRLEDEEKLQQEQEDLDSQTTENDAE